MPKQIVGICGPYDIKIHFNFERQKGVHFASTMGRAMGGAENFDKLSPAVLAESAYLKGEHSPFLYAFASVTHTNALSLKRLDRMHDVIACLKSYTR